MLSYKEFLNENSKSWTEEDFENIKDDINDDWDENYYGSFSAIAVDENSQHEIDLFIEKLNSKYGYDTVKDIIKAKKI